jgi:hypothetical protein
MKNETAIEHLVPTKVRQIEADVRQTVELCENNVCGWEIW